MTAAAEIDDEPEALDGFDLLTEDEQAELEALLDAQVGGESLDEFVERVIPTEPLPDHARILTDLLEQARLRPIRICVSWPPGHAKSTILLRAIAHHLSITPADVCAYVTMSDKKARSKSRKARLWAQRGGVRLSRESNDASDWRTMMGGGLVASGWKGALNGERIPGLLVIDDPFKSRRDAESELVSDEVWEWFKDVATTRLQGGSCIVLHTRWSENDLIGRIARELGWVVINVPAIAEENDPLGREPGEALWPDKYPLVNCGDESCGHDGHLDVIRRTIGEWSWASLYQGRPRPRDKNLFGNEPAQFQLSTFDWKGKRGAIVIDPATTKKTRADHTAMGVFAMEGYGADSKMYVVEVLRMQEEMPEVVKAARRLQSRYKLVIGVEAVAGFKGVPQTIRSLDRTLRVIDIHPDQDKYLRAQGASAAWKQDRLLVPVDAAWANVFVREMHAFTGVDDDEDDQVDMTAHAWNLLYRAAPSDRARGDREEPGA